MERYPITTTDIKRLADSEKFQQDVGVNIDPLMTILHDLENALRSDMTPQLRKAWRERLSTVRRIHGG